jgi:hypothetical protein
MENLTLDVAVDILGEHQIQRLENAIAQFETARAELEHAMQKAGIPRYSDLINLQELLSMKKKRSMIENVKLQGKEERTVETEQHFDNDDLLQMKSRLWESGEPNTSTPRMTDMKVANDAFGNKLAALDHVISLLGSLAQVGAEVRAREIEKVFYVKSRGFDIDKELLHRGNKSAHGPNIAMHVLLSSVFLLRGHSVHLNIANLIGRDALLYAYRLFTGMSIGQRLGDTHFKKFYYIYPDQGMQVRGFPKLLHILNGHFTVKQIQRILPKGFMISSGPFDFGNFLARFENWMQLLKDKDIATDDVMMKDAEALNYTQNLKSRGGWQLLDGSDTLITIL